MVLCGGASRRMGTDKSLLEVDGRPMARRVADALVAAGADGVWALGGDGPGLVAIGLHHVADRAAGEGPLAAVVQALDEIGTEALVAIAPCDLVHPSPIAVTTLVSARDAVDADVAVPLVDARPQWAFAVWHRRVGRLLADVYASGERSIVGAVAGLRIEFVADVDPRGCVDADTPDDLPQTSR